jgi:L-aminopeptidase/D-esterase-like protein
VPGDATIADRRSVVVSFWYARRVVASARWDRRTRHREIAMNQPGPTNTLVDVGGLAVGHAEDRRLRTGVTVIVADEPVVASCRVMGGAPGTRDTDLLAAHQTVDRIDAVVLSGGSAFGLDAASGVQAALRAHGRGFAIGDVRVPIVPGAVIFDLLDGAPKDWGETPPWASLGRRATEKASHAAVPLGSRGAGTGATTADLRGGVGSASVVLADGTTVAALAVVNAVGTATIGSSGHFWAAPHEIGDEFGGLGLPDPWPHDAVEPRLKGAADRPGTATTLVVVATDAILTKAEAERLAVQSHDGFARALWPAHTPLDGDIVFALATGRRALADPLGGRIRLGIAAVEVVARAIARGVHAARAEPGSPLPAWEDLWEKEPEMPLVL